MVFSPIGFSVVSSILTVLFEAFKEKSSLFMPYLIGSCSIRGDAFTHSS